MASILQLFLLFGLTSECCSAAVTYTFTNKASIYDGNVTATDTIVDVVSTEMTVWSNSSFLNSNASEFGIDDDFITGTAEVLTISFDKDIMINVLDFSAIGATVSDGAAVKIGGGAVFNLFTGQPDFNGTTDVYSPSSPVSLLAGETMIITGSDAGSEFSLTSMDITVVPEPSRIGVEKFA